MSVPDDDNGIDEPRIGYEVVDLSTEEKENKMKKTNDLDRHIESNIKKNQEELEKNIEMEYDFFENAAPLYAKIEDDKVQINCDGRSEILKLNKKGSNESIWMTEKASLRKKSSKDERIKLSNRFSILMEEPCKVEIESDKCYKLFMIGKRNIFHISKQKKIPKKLKQNQIDFKLEEGSVTKYGSDYFKHFETSNRFEMLLGHQETNVSSILEVNKLLNAPKQSLKRCKKCNLRRRTCAVDPSSCKALQYLCSSCNKFGHAPKSRNCKGETKCRASKNGGTSYKWSKQWKADVFLLLMKRIVEIQEIEQIDEIRRLEILTKNRTSWG